MTFLLSPSCADSSYSSSCSDGTSSCIRVRISEVDEDVPASCKLRSKSRNMDMPSGVLTNAGDSSKDVSRRGTLVTAFAREDVLIVIVGSLEDDGEATDGERVCARPLMPLIFGCKGPDEEKSYGI